MFSTITRDDKEYRFNTEKFCRLIRKKQRELPSSGKPIPETQIFKELSELLYTTPDAIKNWRYGRNGPDPNTDIEVLLSYFDAEITDMFDPVDTIASYDNSDADRREVSRVFGECLNILFGITHFRPEEGLDAHGRGIQRNENTRNAVCKVRLLDQSVYAHALFVSSGTSNQLHRLLKDMESFAENRLTDSVWDDVSDVSCYSFEITRLQYFLFDSKKDICEDSPGIDGAWYLNAELDYADDLRLGDTVEPDDYFDDHCDEVEVVMQYGYQGDYEITPTMVYDHLLTKYMADVFHHHFPDLFS